MTRIRLYIDEDAQRRALIQSVRARGYDVVTTSEAGRLSLSDDDQLAYSAVEGRTLVTFNSRDFVHLHRKFLIGGRSHAGIIVSNQLETGVLVRRLLRLLQSRSAEDMANWLEFLSNWR